MNHPYLFIAGCAIVGWLLPEALVLGGARVPQAMNFVAAVAAALIAAGFVA